MEKDDKILVFIPMYNCEKQIIRVLAQLEDPNVASYFSGVICIDNRSIDNTLQNAVNALKNINIPHRAVLKNVENYNLGGSHKVAFNYALKHDFTHIVVLHGDDQGSILDLIPHIKSKAYKDSDCLLGSRFMKGSRLVGYSKFRIFGNKVFNKMFSVVARQRIYDLGAGLNLYDMKMLQDNFYHSFADNLTFNCYLLLASTHRRCKIQFFPLTWREDDQVSNAKLFKQSVENLKLLKGMLLKPDVFLKQEHRVSPQKTYEAEVYALLE